MTILKKQMTRPVYMISYLEAQRIFDDGFPSFEDMIAGAKNRFNLPPNAWSEVDRVIRKTQKGKLLTFIK